MGRKIPTGENGNLQEKILKIQVSSSPCKKLGSHHSVPTRIKVQETKISTTLLGSTEEDTGQTATPKIGDTDTDR